MAMEGAAALTAMQLTLKTPKNMPSYMKDMFARDVIKLIINRTRSGVDSNGNSFAQYSKAYKESQIFKDRGKNPYDVNLTLYGDMLESMTHRKTSDGVVIYFDDGVEALKAHGHNNGSKILPKRHFFDVNNEEYMKLYRDYERLIERTTSDRLNDVINEATVVKRPKNDRGYSDSFGVDVETFEGVWDEFNQRS